MSGQYWFKKMRDGISQRIMGMKKKSRKRLLKFHDEMVKIAKDDMQNQLFNEVCQEMSEIKNSLVKIEMFADAIESGKKIMREQN
jgi:RNA-binding protein YhbY